MAGVRNNGGRYGLCMALWTIDLILALTWPWRASGTF